MAKSNIQVLSPDQLRYIQKKVAEAFSEDLHNQLSLDVKNFEKQIQQIVKSMELEEIFDNKTGKHKGWKIASLTPRRQSLAMRGYILIFKFREFLLNEKINYRYYYEDDQGKSHVAEFTEENIAQYVKFTSAGIQINPSVLKSSKKIIKAEWDLIINEYFQQYSKSPYMQKVKNGYGYVGMHSSIMEQYFNRNPSVLKTKAGHDQKFNKGHIYEAIDNSLSHLLFKDNIEIDNITTEAMQNYVFGKYLMLDNIKASQGGDNALTNTSIKSGKADLYDFYTIKTQLEAILALLQTSPVNKKTMTTTISKLFLHKSKFEDSENSMQEAANSALDKLLNTLKASH